MTGKLALSKAGHDKGKIYIIIREETEYVYLADGVLKTYRAPKKKNRKHIQPINEGFTQEEMRQFAEKPQTADAAIKHIINRYTKDRKF